jgi:hypothetical protein
LIEAICLSHPEPVLTTVSVWGFRGTFIWAVFRSGQGLFQMRHEPTRWKRGQRQAWAVMSFGLFFVFLNSLAILNVPLAWLPTARP